MEDDDYKPDIDNFNALLYGLCKSRRTDLALEMFETMIEKGYMPNQKTYTIVVEGIIHEGKKELATQVLKELHSRQVISLGTAERLIIQYDLSIDI